ncbi:MAG: mechanosensitive ion channel family protein [Bacteroidota bacterium]
MKKLIFLFLLVSGYVFAQGTVKVDLSNPNATLYTHLYFLQDGSYEPTKAAATIKGLRQADAIEKSIKIKQIIDGRGLNVDFDRIPTDPDFLDTISSSSNILAKPRHFYMPFPHSMPEIYLEKIGTKWYYSKETVGKIDKLHSEIFPWEFKWLKDKFPTLYSETVFGVKWIKLIGFLLLIIASFLLYYVLNPILFFILKKIQNLLIRFKKDVLGSEDKNLRSYELLHGLTKSIVLIIIIRLIKRFLPVLQLVKINNFLFLALEIAETVFWVFLFLNIIKVVLIYYDNFSARTHSKLDDQLSPILRKLFKGLVIIIGVLHIITLFGVNPTTVIAGASIGGIALALAAQDSVKNLIGTVVIFLDKPFHIGDWVEIGEVVGTVEKVGFRSTRVRAIDTSIFQIPNSKVAEAEVNNKGMRIYRRYNTELGIRYDTPPELIEAFVKGIREIIIAHPETRSESYNVEFTGFGDSSLRIMINMFFKQLDWGIEQSSKHKLHIAIVKLAEALGVQFAYPSSTLMIEQFPDKESISVKYNTSSDYIDESIKKVIKDFENMADETDPNASSIPDR